MTYQVPEDRKQIKRDLFRAQKLVPQEGYDLEIARRLKDYGFDAKVRDE